MILATLWSCTASRTGTLIGDALDRQLLKTATADYLQAKYLPDLFFARRRSLLMRSKMSFVEVLNDSGATPKSKREAADMLGKVNSQLENISK